MWLVFAVGSAVFAGITAILTKIGVKSVSSDLVTALRTSVVVIFSWLMVLIVGSVSDISSISSFTLLFLTLSGLSTGISWFMYNRALQLGDVNKVTPVDKSSTVLTILLAFIILGETPTVYKIIGMTLITAGTLMMTVKRSSVRTENHRQGWVLYAAGSAFFAALTSIFGKIGVKDIESNLAVAIRTIVVLIMAWLIIMIKKKTITLKTVDKRSWIFIILSGIATGLSWLCYYRALQLGQASVVVPIDKLSILITILFSYLVLKEKLTKTATIGLLLLTAGTLSLLIQ